MHSRYFNEQDFLLYKKCSKAFWFQQHRSDQPIPSPPIKTDPERAALRQIALPLFFPAQWPIFYRLKAALFRHPVWFQPNSDDPIDRQVHTSHRALKRSPFLFQPKLRWSVFEITPTFLFRSEKQWILADVMVAKTYRKSHIWALTMQAFVLKQLGISVSSIRMLYINGRYCRRSQLNARQLFVDVSVTQDVQHLLKIVEKELRNLAQYQDNDKKPRSRIGPKCMLPVDCEFKAECWPKLSDHSIFELSGLSLSEKFQLFHNGHRSLIHLPGNLVLNRVQQDQVQLIHSGKPLIRVDELREFLSVIHYPLSFLDFEAYQSAVPLFAGMYPFQHVPFLYSLHIQQTPDCEAIHSDFLAKSDSDPRQSFIASLLNHLPSQGSIIVYSQDLESKILKDIAKKFPEHRQQIAQLLSRFVDLSLPFKQQLYLSPLMKGSYSIKGVLPALCPELSYKGLDISNGKMATESYKHILFDADKHNHDAEKNHLRAYCQLDNLAMVKILRVLLQACA